MCGATELGFFERCERYVGFDFDDRLSAAQAFGDARSHQHRAVRADMDLQRHAGLHDSGASTVQTSGVEPNPALKWAIPLSFTLAFGPTA